MLCVGAGLMLKSFRRIQRVDRGFDVTHLLTFRIQPSDVRYPAPRAPALIERGRQSIAAVPGVVSATVDAGPPFENIFASSPLRIVGQPDPRPDLAPPVTRNYVGPDHRDLRRAGPPPHTGDSAAPRPRAHAGGPRRTAPRDDDQPHRGAPLLARAGPDPTAGVVRRRQHLRPARFERRDSGRGG